MMGVISRTDFIQRQFTSEIEKNSGSYKTHQAPTKKIFSFSETSITWMSLAFKFTQKGHKSLFIKDLLTQAEKGKALTIIKNSTSTGEIISK